MSRRIGSSRLTRVHAFKPAPEAYQFGVDALGLRKEEITFAAYAAWDAAGAGWFGYPSVWINRLGQPAEALDIAPVAEGSDLSVLSDFIKLRLAHWRLARLSRSI